MSCHQVETPRSPTDYVLMCRFPYCFADIGLNGTAGLSVGLIVACSVIPTMGMQFLGSRRRKSRMIHNIAAVPA